MLSIVLVKVTTLLSGCGGPLILYNMLKPRLDDTIAFCVVFAPLGLMLFASMDLVEGEGGIAKTWWVRLQLFGALTVLLMHLWGAIVLATEAVHRADHALYVMGIVIGIPTAAGVAYFSQRRLAGARAPHGLSSPIEPS